MDKLLYVLFTIAYLALLIWGLKGIKINDFSKWTSIIYLVVVALIYDNGILAIGDWIGEGDFLRGLNAARYWLHAFVTPLLVIFSIGTLREAGITWAKKSWVKVLTLLYTLTAITIEILTVTADLKLEVERAYGVISYSSAEPSNGPPIMILMITFAILIASVLLWKRTGWAVFFFGVVIMTIGSAIPLDINSNAITNLFELILLSSLIWTKRKLLLDKLKIR